MEKLEELEKFFGDLFERTNSELGNIRFIQDSYGKNEKLGLPFPFMKIMSSTKIYSFKEQDLMMNFYKKLPNEKFGKFNYNLLAESLGVELLSILEKKGYEIDNKIKIAFLVNLLIHNIGRGSIIYPLEKMIGLDNSTFRVIGKRVLFEDEEIKKNLEKIFPGLTDMVINFKGYDKYGLSQFLDGEINLYEMSFISFSTYPKKENREGFWNECVEKIFESTVLDNGQCYFDSEGMPYIDYYLKKRNYFVKDIQNPNKVLVNNVLKKIGNYLLNFRGTKDYQEKMAKLPDVIAKEIEDFIEFLEKAKNKKDKIDLNEYYSRRNFNRLFYLLLLLDDYELNRDCLTLLNSADMNSQYYDISINSEFDGSEEYIGDLESEEYTNLVNGEIVYVNPDHSKGDFTGVVQKKKNEHPYSLVSYRLSSNVPLMYEGEIRNKLIDKMNQVLLKNIFSLAIYEPVKKYENTNNEILRQVNLYVKSLKKGISFYDYLVLNDITEHQLLTYILIACGEVSNICLMLLSDNLGVYLKDDSFGLDEDIMKLVYNN